MQVPCTQCGAKVEVGPGAHLVDCGFCGTALAVDAGRSLFAYALQPTVDPAAAQSHLRRFLGGRQTVAGLDREARLEDPELVYFPFWAFQLQGPGGAERTRLIPAAPSALQGLQGIELPPGRAVATDGERRSGAGLRSPEVPVETARTWMEEREQGTEIVRTVLYHLPLYLVSYSYRGQRYRAAVDGVSGKVYPAHFPSKAEAPYVAVAVVSLLVFTVEGFLFSNLLVKALVFAVTAVPLFAVAWWTSTRV